MIIIRQEPPSSKDAIELLEKSCEYIIANCPEDFDHTFKLDVLASSNARFFIVRNEGLAVGCGAYVHLDIDTVEIKHVYVSDSARGLGLGKKLLIYIETIAKQNNVKKIVLETNTSLTAACELYSKFDYKICNPYKLNHSASDIFMFKHI